MNSLRKPQRFSAESTMKKCIVNVSFAIPNGATNGTFAVRFLIHLQCCIVELIRPGHLPIKLFALKAQPDGSQWQDRQTVAASGSRYQ